jgi:hypothetical protein
MLLQVAFELFSRALYLMTLSFTIGSIFLVALARLLSFLGLMTPERNGLLWDFLRNFT